LEIFNIKPYKNFENLHQSVKRKISTFLKFGGRGKESNLPGRQSPAAPPGLKPGVSRCPPGSHPLHQEYNNIIFLKKTKLNKQSSSKIVTITRSELKKRVLISGFEGSLY